MILDKPLVRGRLKKLKIVNIEFGQVLPPPSDVPQLSPASRSANDIDYECGLRRLNELLTEQPPQIQREFHTLEARLLDHLKNTHWFGDNENTRAGRMQVISILNDLMARAGLGSFMDLCRLK